jgi:genome maintenance exonuclease 1
MIINQRFEYQKLDRVTQEDGTRHYTCPVTQAPLASVTTVISATEDKSSLEAWEKAVGKKKADAVRHEATVLGTLMHTHLEMVVEGREADRPRGNMPIRQLAKRMSDVVIDRGLSNVTEVWGQEVALYVPGLYAGTTDLVGTYKGRPAIMDHKTAKKLKTREMIDGYLHQLAAYTLAHNVVHGTEIDLGVIFMVDRELKFCEFIIEGDELRRYQDSFLTRVETFLAAQAEPPQAA